MEAGYGIHKDIIKKYISISIDLGVDSTEGAITDELVERIKSRLAQGESLLHIPRDDILLPHKDRIEAYLKKGLKGSKIMTLLARDGIVVGSSSMLR